MTQLLARLDLIENPSRNLVSASRFCLSAVQLKRPGTGGRIDGQPPPPSLVDMVAPERFDYWQSRYITATGNEERTDGQTTRKYCRRPLVATQFGHFRFISEHFPIYRKMALFLSASSLNSGNRRIIRCQPRQQRTRQNGAGDG